ncbi:NHLP family bacteriocin export ABC transporter peptidase/permease/ATPase subunit [Mitsuaria sp. WAJ17]|uniref:NHLP family bacteriocin export ABC transporter peptidase/permease/ATPase subunit n=1 Tax=Mitsuaria sp. WAJ17 TaxID=2761452 RepID=UPI001602E7F1|nr:NHLP family bacteriocin export ABC transporter peptidase/permease/ATPase subunit [Mitsuaria sp. WAJ17]MBB2484693.1 NHLP family bacteriocin export ABC transporter peptidase/permease/ATPase subunit [Mitsuaria sp. WAJ17]
MLSLITRCWHALRGGRGASPRVRAPTILQMEAVECGAASLAMVLAYHGRHVSLAELRTACGVSRDGTKALNLVKAARGYGLEARAFKAEPAQLAGLPLPAVLYWNFNHFLLLEGVGRDTFHLNDPARGRREVSAAEFDTSFTGIVLTFGKTEHFEPGGRPDSLLEALRSRLGDTRWALTYLLLVGLLLVVPGIAVPAFSAIFIDTILVGQLQGWIGPLVLGMAATSALLGALTWLQHYYLLRLEARIALGTSARFFWHVLRLPLSFFQQRSASEVSSRVLINARVAEVLSGDLVDATLGLITATFFAAVMLFYDPWMGMLSIGVAGVNFGLLRAVSVKRRELNMRLAIDQSKVMGTSMDGLMLIETLKASGWETDFFARWAGFQARFARSMQEMSRTSIPLDLAPRLLSLLNATAILGIGGLRVMSGEMSMGSLVAFQMLVASFMGPINTLVSLGAKLQSFHGDVKRLDDALDAPIDTGPDDDSEVTDGTRLSGALELRQLTFGFSRMEPPLLENFNLQLKPGQRVALVGPSGCGKSTIAKLVAGLHQPWQGEILLDRIPRSAVPRHQLLNSVAVVDQDISLFSGTVRDNLTLWDRTVPDSVMIQAARDAQIHDFISSRPGGYQSLVSEGGANFSGGQRQRLEIARALSTNPRLLILDEATSALDPLTERLVEQSIRRRGCSCLVIAHRLSAIRDCDEIIFLERGKVLERGTHATLMALGGHYARLVSDE